MQIYAVTYYKLGHRWYLDFPEHLEKGIDPEDLEQIGAFHDFLEVASEGEETIMFEMSEEPFEGADVAQLTGSTGERTGGLYQLSSFEGRSVDYELWFNTIIYLTQPALPQRIHLKKKVIT